MSNRLQKLAITEYFPGRPYEPATPAYCINAPGVSVPTRFVAIRYTVVYRDGKPVYVPVYQRVPAHTEYQKVCFPAKPAVSAIPAKVTYTAVTGWNAGANSKTALVGDGYVEFSVSSHPFGVVVGISSGNRSSLPNEQSHAFYIHGNTVDVLEDGRAVATAVITHNSSRRYRIERSGNTVRMLVDGWSRTSWTQSAGPVVLDASLYASGDYVESPVVMASPTSMGAAAGTIRALTGRAGVAAYCEASGTIGPLSGEATALPYAFAKGQILALSGVAADRPYGSAVGIIPALTGEAIGGFPQVSIASVVGAIAPLTGVGVGFSGEIGSAAGAIGPLVGQAADRPYGAAVGSIAALTGFAEEGLGPFESFFSSGLVIGNAFTSPLQASDVITSKLVIGNAFVDGVVAGDVFFNTLIIGSSFTSEYAVEEYFQSGLRIGSRFISDTELDGIEGQLARERAQYAVNQNTGAPTQYVGFDFSGFAWTGTQLYGSRPDGVYLVRPGDDDGQALSGMIDFGASDYGTSQAKRVDSVYFGMHTDACVTLRLATDSGDHRYPVSRNGPMSRAVGAKGASGRLWNMRLDFEEATHFELDTTEALVGASTRRLGRR